jgi:Fic family protein
MQKKYQSIAQVSKATATRHLQDLVDKGILVSHKAGRSTNYQVNID